MTRAYTLAGYLAGLGPPYNQPPAESPPESSATAGSAPGEPAVGQLVVIEAGGSRIVTVEPGKRLLVGRDAEAELRVSDPRVAERHATIERRGDMWAVQDIDAIRPTRLIDAWGTNRQVRGETTISSGQLVVGEVRITLFVNQP
jgi:pSer/pThr/pTyr-binding forkhead associated (FHA) protein